MDIKQVTFAYPERPPVLHQVSGHIPSGQITTIIGPNGSGKSTLLGVMSAQYVPQQGEVLFRGRSLQQYKLRELAREMAVVHQHNTAPADITVERLVHYGRIPHRSFLSGTSSEDQEAVEWALQRTKLIDKREARFHALSGGERQRVWIAMALAQRTSLLLLDEPTTFLDIYYQYEILDLVQEINETEQMTIVMVLHDMNQALKYSDHVMAMKDGKVFLCGNPDEVMTAEMIQQVYGMQVVVRDDAEAGRVILPIRILSR